MRVPHGIRMDFDIDNGSIFVDIAVDEGEGLALIVQEIMNQHVTFRTIVGVGQCCPGRASEFLLGISDHMAQFIIDSDPRLIHCDNGHPHQA